MSIASEKKLYKYIVTSTMNQQLPSEKNSHQKAKKVIAAYFLLVSSDRLVIGLVLFIAQQLSLGTLLPVENIIKTYFLLQPEICNCSLCLSFPLQTTNGF